jgi:preprotein translocase subunit SecY
METFTRKLKILFGEASLRNSIFFTLAALIVFRFLGSIPLPGVNPALLAEFLSRNQFFSFLNIFSGGGLSQLSIIVLGVGPYITSSIIMQVMTTAFPKLKQMFHEEGSIGRKRFNQYVRFLAVPVAMIQSFGMITLLTRQGALSGLGIWGTVGTVLVITAGSFLVTWLGELITEFGVGNGVSLLIFGGIVSSLPGVLGQMFAAYTPSELFNYVLYALVVLVVIVAVVLVTEAERHIGITYAKQVRGMQTYGGSKTYIPMRINQAGVMPIIFALSILLFPQMIANYFITSSTLWISNAAGFVNMILRHEFWYPFLYFILVFAFTYFYTAITFDPESVAENLHKSGAFIPGIRPGLSTTEHLAKIAIRITFFGALFLSLIAILPVVMLSVTGNQAVAIGGTSVLIVVSVILDLIKKMDAQISMRQY